MDERRQLPRWEVKKEVKVWVPLLQAFSHCVVEDIHLKGMCVSFKKQLHNEKPLRMSFALGDNYNFIKIEADVPWEKRDNDKFVYGLSFNRIDEQDKEKLYQYINSNCYNQLKDKWWGA